MAVLYLSPFTCLLLGLMFTGLGVYAAAAGSTFTLVVGVVFLVCGVGNLTGCLLMRRSGYGWLQALEQRR